MDVSQTCKARSLGKDLSRESEQSQTVGKGHLGDTHNTHQFMKEWHMNVVICLKKDYLCLTCSLFEGGQVKVIFREVL